MGAGGCPSPNRLVLKFFWLSRDEVIKVLTLLNVLNLMLTKCFNTQNPERTLHPHDLPGPGITLPLYLVQL